MNGKTSGINLSRRALLRDLGIGAALVPLLQARPARAAIPKRLIIAINSNGQIRPEFFPRRPGAAYQDNTPPGSYALNGMELGIASKPLEPHKSDLIFLGNLAMRNVVDYVPADRGGYPGCSHRTYASTFTGRKPLAASQVDAAGVTIDQFIADKIADNVRLPLRFLATSPTTTPRTSDQAKVWATHAFYRGPGAQVECETSVNKAFASVFPQGAATGTDPAAFAQLRKNRKSILDFVRRDLASFSARLGTEDRHKLDVHLQSVRDLEDQLITTAVTPAACVPPDRLGLDDDGAALSGGDGVAGDATTDYLKRCRFFSDLTVAAFKCDLTRVAVMRFACSNGDGVVYDAGGMQNLTSHGLAHNPGTTKPIFDAVQMQQLAYLIQRMKDIPEGTGSMLDNTVILWANHMGDGNAHDMVNLPWVLAGNCGGYFKTGQFLQSPKLTPLNGVFVALANALDIPITTFGDTKGYAEDFPAGPLPGLS